MGRGIAYAAAVGGFETLLHDVSEGALERSLAKILEDLEQGVARGKLTPAEAEAAGKRVRAEASLEAATRAADFVIEAVPEDIALKLTLFGRLDELARSDVVLATNTSALSPTQIASATKRPERVLGMHFVNP